MLKSRKSIIFSIPALLVLSLNKSASAAAPNFSRLVVVGDSLAAGVQNFSLLDYQQSNGFASVIAKQAGVPLNLPLIPYPGMPNVLQLLSQGPPLVIQPASGAWLFPRENPLNQAFNIAVPGITVNDALTLRPSLDPNVPPVQQWATAVLGFPSLLFGEAPTQMELAKTLNPTTVIASVGNNDALVPALVGQLSALTPVDRFAQSYKQVLDALSETGATIITANIPDVTEIPFFTSAQTIADSARLPLATVTAILGIGPGDYARITAQDLVDGILTGAMRGPLPASCASPLAALSTSPVPCVLTAADAAKIRSVIACYNAAIASETVSHGAVLVDVHSLVDQIYTQGYKTEVQQLSTNFLGGLFSLDGIHPSNTGYALIANRFIETINGSFDTSLPKADVDAIAASDPLVFPGRGGPYTHPAPSGSNSCNASAS